MGSKGLWVLFVVVVGALAWWFLRDAGPVPSRLNEGDVSPATRPESPTLRGTHAAVEEEPTAWIAPTVPDGHARIDVEVVDPDGRPLEDVPIALHVRRRSFVAHYEAGAAVALLDEPSRAAGAPVARGASDADGRLSFENLDPTQDYRVLAMPRPPYTLAGRDAVASARPGSWVRLVLPGAGSPLRVRIVDAEGQGREGTVALRLVAPERPYVQGWNSGPRATDAAGRLAFPAVPHGVHEARVTVAGYGERTRVPVRVPAEGEMVLRLAFESGATVFGTVQGAERKPIEGARVLARCGGYAHEDVPSLVRMATTGADGRYRFTGLPPGRLVGMDCVAEGLARPESSRFRRVLLPGADVQIDFDLQRGSYVRGRVLTIEDQPVPGAYVETTVALTHCSLCYRLKVRAAEDGSYALGPLPLGRGVATPKAPGYHVLGDDASGGWNGRPGRPFDFTVAGSELHADLRMEPGRPVTGRVVDSQGKAVAGAAVRLIGPQELWAAYAAMERVSTDASGVFRFPGLPPVSGFKVRVTNGHARRDAEIERGRPNEIVLPAPASVSGRVVWPAQGPDVTWYVTVSPAEGRDRRIRALGRDGCFEIDGLPAGRTTLRVLDGFKEASGTVYDAVLAAGQRVEGVELRPESLLTIEGIVVGEAGEPKPGYAVGVTMAGGPSRDFTARSDVEGRFRLGLLPDGHYTVSAEGASASATVRAGTGDVRLVVDQVKPVLGGIVLLPDGSPLPRADVGVLVPREGTTPTWYRVGVSAGRFEYELPLGTASVEITIGNAVDAAGRALNVRTYNATLPVGTPVTIRLETARRVSGVVVTEQGIGVPGVRLLGLSTGGRRSSVRGGTAINAVSNAEGRFELVGLEDDETLRVQVRDVPAGFALPSPVEVGPTGTSVRVVLHDGGGAVAGRVVDAEGQPLAGVFVRGTFGDVQVTATTGPKGRFELSGVPRSLRGGVEALPQVGHHPYQPVTVDGVEAGQRDVVIELSAGHLLEGVIEGADVEGLSVAFFVGSQPRKSVKTGAGGVFRISLAETAAGTLVVIDPRHNRYAVLEGVVPTRTGLEVALQTGETIRGRVVVADGKAAEPLLVLAISGVARAQVRVEGDHSFQLSGLPPGTYDLHVIAVRSSRRAGAMCQGVEAGSTDVLIEFPQK